LADEFDGGVDLEPFRDEARAWLEKRRYDKFSGEPTSEVALDRKLKEDLFVILASIHENERVTIRAIINPLINWYWIGGIVAFFGGLYVLLPDFKRKEEAAE